MYLVIVSKLSYGQPVVPIILPLVHKELEELFNFLVDSFGLPICLGVISHGSHYSDP